jgi:putative transposase
MPLKKFVASSSIRSQVQGVKNFLLLLLDICTFDSVNSILWRSVKYEEVYLYAYDSVSEARALIGRYLDFYNGRRPHSSLDGTTPDKAYFTLLPLRLAA